MKNVKVMTVRELANFILKHKEDVIEFAMENKLYPDSPQSTVYCRNWWFVRLLDYPEYMSHNIFLDYCGGGAGISFPYQKETIQEELFNIIKDMCPDINENKEPIVYVDISSYIKIECVEICPHCDREVEINWCTKEDGYEIYCPYCGQKMLLCDDCMHSPDNKAQHCDWCKETGCFRNRK